MTIALYARGGAVGIGELTETGDFTFIELLHIRTRRNSDKNGRYRWYNDYQLPDRYHNQTITVRLHTNADDTAWRFNRAETSGPSHPMTPTSHGSIPAVTMQNQSTAVSKTASGSAGLIASATRANTSTCSATRSWSTGWPSTATGDTAPTNSPRSSSSPHV